MRNIMIEKADYLPVEEREGEIVERKGIGHPDTICDGVAEKVSQILSQYYLKKFKKVLHHNLDKALLIAGKSEPKFLGGKILEKIKIIVAGRATDRVGNFKIPVKEIGENAIKNWLKKNLQFSQKEIKNYFEISLEYQPGALNLKEVFKRSKTVLLANDTSFGVAFAPLNLTELSTLKLADFINSKSFLKIFPYLGKDIKVMTLRKKEAFTFTVALPFISQYIKNTKDYFQKKEKVKIFIEKFLKAKLGLRNFVLNINALDKKSAKNENEIYLTVLGLSAEQGDDGQLGRGNRVWGLITPFREMSLEAVCGKNIYHPGKLYQVMAYLIAQKISKINGVKECTVKILSEIGKPLDDPQVIHVKILAKNINLIKHKIVKIVKDHFDNLVLIQDQIVKGKYRLF